MIRYLIGTAAPHPFGGGWLYLEAGQGFRLYIGKIGPVYAQILTGKPGTLEKPARGYVEVARLPGPVKAICPETGEAGEAIGKSGDLVRVYRGEQKGLIFHVERGLFGEWQAHELNELIPETWDDDMHMGSDEIPER